MQTSSKKSFLEKKTFWLKRIADNENNLDLKFNLMREGEEKIKW